MEERMKAAVLYAIGDLRVVEVGVPCITSGEALIRVKTTGVCGSDIPRVMTRGAYHFPIVPGHEISGEVYRLGGDMELRKTTEPTAVALHAIRRAGVDAGERVAVLGAGPVGVIAAQWARILGAEEIFLVDLFQERLKVAEALGFRCINASRENPVERILQETDGLGVDVCLEAAGAPETFKQSIQMTRKLGKVVFMGNISDDLTLPQEVVSSILRKELVIYGSWNSSFTSLPVNEWTTTLDFMASGRLKVEPLISHRFVVEEAPRAFDMMYQKREFFNKVLFVFD